MDSNIYTEIIINKSVIITPNKLNKQLDDNIISQLKNDVENKCLEDGFIIEDNIKILKRSVGFLIRSKFNGNMKYNILFSTLVCNPQKNAIIDCKIKNINKLGILAVIGPLVIIIPNELSDIKHKFKNLKIDDVIKIVVLDKKFKLNDKNISIVGKIYNKNEYAKSLQLNTFENTLDTLPNNFNKTNINQIQLSDTLDEINSLAEDDETTNELLNNNYYTGDYTEVDEEKTQNLIDLENNNTEKDLEIYSDNDDQEEDNLLNDIGDDQLENKIIVSGGYNSDLEEVDISKETENNKGKDKYDFSSDDESFVDDESIQNEDDNNLLGYY